jgi:hypothetical protein
MKSDISLAGTELRFGAFEAASVYFGCSSAHFAVFSSYEDVAVSNANSWERLVYGESTGTDRSGAEPELDLGKVCSRSLFVAIFSTFMIYAILSVAKIQKLNKNQREEEPQH